MQLGQKGKGKSKGKSPARLPAAQQPKAPAKAAAGYGAPAASAEVADLKRQAVQRGMLFKDASTKTPAELRAFLQKTSPAAPASPAATAAPSAAELAELKRLAMQKGMLFKDANAMSPMQLRQFVQGKGAAASTSGKGQVRGKHGKDAAKGKGKGKTAKAVPRPKAAGIGVAPTKQEMDAAAAKIQATYRGKVARQQLAQPKAAGAPKAKAKGTGKAIGATPNANPALSTPPRPKVAMHLHKAPPVSNARPGPKPPAPRPPSEEPRLPQSSQSPQSQQSQPEPDTRLIQEEPQEPTVEDDAPRRGPPKDPEAQGPAVKAAAPRRGPPKDDRKLDRGLEGDFAVDPTGELMGGLHMVFGWPAEADGQHKVQQEAEQQGAQDPDGFDFFSFFGQPQPQGQEEQGQQGIWPFGLDGGAGGQDTGVGWWPFGGDGGNAGGGSDPLGNVQVETLRASERPRAAASAAVRRRRPQSAAAARPVEPPVDRRFPMAAQLRNREDLRAQSAPKARRGAVQEHLERAERVGLQAAGITAIVPGDAEELSDPESQESAESISGDVVRAWDPSSRDKRYLYFRDRAVQFSQGWQPLEWTEKDWEKMLRETGALAPPEFRQQVQEKRESTVPRPSSRPRLPRTLSERFGRAAGTIPETTEEEAANLEQWRRIRKLRQQDDSTGTPSAPDALWASSYLRLHVVSASSLGAGSFHATTDPYVKARIGREVRQTKVVQNSDNPRWGEVLQFRGVQSSETLTLTVWDQDVSGITDDHCLGRLDLPLQAFQRRLAAGQVVKIHERLRQQESKDGRAELWVELSLGDHGASGAGAAAWISATTGDNEVKPLQPNDLDLRGLLPEATLGAVQAEAVHGYIEELKRSKPVIPSFPNNSVISTSENSGCQAPGPGQAWL